MEAKIKVSPDLTLIAQIPEGCSACAALRGEVAQAVKALNQQNTTIDSATTLKAQCHATAKTNTRHVEVKVQLSAGKPVSSDTSVRDWAKRTVHCSH